VIVHAYEEDEERCLDRFRGMFSFALWDAPRRSLLLVVDRFGIKPLYYAATATGIVCGSELKCLLRSGLFDRNLDLDALAQYFTLNYVPPPATIFTGAQRLPPASLLRWTANGGTTVRQYWELPRDRVQQARPPAEARRQLRGVAQLLPASLRSAAGAVPRLLERASRSRFNDRVAALGRRTADTLLPPGDCLSAKDNGGWPRFRSTTTLIRPWAQPRRSRSLCNRRPVAFALRVSQRGAPA
jgi:asparagine synthetase B (glutamine-hydrolysing)